MNDQNPDRRPFDAFADERAVPILIAAALAAAVAIQALSHFTALGVATVVAIGAILLIVAARVISPGGRAVAPAEVARMSAAPAADPMRTATLDAAIDGVVSVDGNGIVREWNAAARNTFGHSAGDAIGQNLSELLVPPAQRERYGRMIAGSTVSADNPLLDRPIEAMALHASGAEFPIELSVSIVSSDPLMFTGFVRDISERRHQEQANERLTSLIGSSQDAIVSLDLDEVVTGWSDGATTLFGYSAQEALGKPFANLTGARAGSLVARVRGDDGSPLELECAGKNEKSIFVSIRAFPIRDVAGEIVGISTSGHDVTERRLREERARQDTDGQLWRERVAFALANDGFLFWGQPVVSMETGLIHHHELLLRMNLNGELVSPGKFLRHVEGTELISEIDRWALRNGIDYAGDLPVAIKLSAMGLTNKEVLEIVGTQLADGAPPENVILEVTESAAADDLEAVRVMVGELADLGCKVALDDFGTGYGSFSYLKQLPVSQLKIDMQFVRNLVNDASDQLVVRSMITVAENFGLITVAEGVEDEPTLQLLRSLGVDLVQGYHVGYPARMTAGGTGAALIAGSDAGSAGNAPQIVIETSN